MGPVNYDIFGEFKEYSIAEFFKKNRQMLGFSGKIRSLTTIVHEYCTNSLDATEEVGILPQINVSIDEIKEDTYKVMVEDNGPGIPQTHLGKALGSMLAGTKFHRYIQQRGQQGIGAAGCTMYALLTTGKPIKVISMHKGQKITCSLSIDFKTNNPVYGEVQKEEYDSLHGLIVEGEFGDVKYDRGVYGVGEYLKRTALANPHATIKFKEPDGNVITFPRSSDKIPPKVREIQPHPLGITTFDLMEFARKDKKSRTLSSFFQQNFDRFSLNKVKELQSALPSLDMNRGPKSLTWDEAKLIVEQLKKMKWIAPPTDALVSIGKEQIEKSLMNILNPKIVYVVERSPKIYRGGIPFLVEVGIAYGGTGRCGEVMRFGNRAPLLFDSGGCAITEAVKSIEWRRYDIKNFEEEPIIVFVNISSVHIPYTGAGKQAIAADEEMVSEIKNAVMECARGMGRLLKSEVREKERELKKQTVMRYVKQLSQDLSELVGEKKEDIEKRLINIIEKKYQSFKDVEEGGGENE